MFRDKLREIIFGYRTRAGKIFDIVLLAAIILSLVGVIMDSDKEIHNKYGSVLLTIEWVFTIFFTIEYALRIYSSRIRKKYIFSAMGIIDLLSIIPTYLTLVVAGPIGHLSDIRIMRLIRVFRIFRLTPYLKSGHRMQIALRSSRPKIIVFILYISLVVVVLGTLMYIVEGQKNGFESIADSIYWAVVTLTTVGYGDVVPSTGLGKTISVLIMLLGYAIIAVPTGIVSSEMSANKNTKKQSQNQDKILAKEDKIIAKLEELEKQGKGLGDLRYFTARSVDLNNYKLLVKTRFHFKDVRKKPNKIECYINFGDPNLADLELQTKNQNFGVNKAILDKGFKKSDLNKIKKDYCSWNYFD